MNEQLQILLDYIESYINTFSDIDMFTGYQIKVSHQFYNNLIINDEWKKYFDITLRRYYGSFILDLKLAEFGKSYLNMKKL